MRHLLASLTLGFVCTSALAQTPVPAPAASVATPAAATSITTLQAITVTGVVPGPGLWKVSRGDHVLWILGVVPTVPMGIEWRSNQVARTIADSQAVLDAPGVKLKLDTNWFGKLFLLVPAYHAQRNPDGKILKDVLPQPLYARWETARQRYFGEDHGIERYRPILAASKLMKKALKANGLRSDGAIEDTITGIAKRYAVKVVKPDTTLEIRDPHKAIDAFAASGPDGVACLGLVLGAIEHQLPDFRARANAWATGDIATLRKIPPSPYRETCKSAITGAGFAKSLGIDNLPARIEGKWLAAADAALAANTQSFAVLPMHDLLDPHGYAAALQARGYTVVAPDAGAAINSAAASASGTAPATSVAAAPATSTP